MNAFDGIQVVELASEIAGPYCGKLLADLGATVTRLELAPGDPLRQWGPFPNGENDPERSGLFHYLNGAKRLRQLDPTDQAGWTPLIELARNADVLLEDLGPAELEARGVDLEELQSANPRLIVVRISDFGQYGPYVGAPCTPLVRQAASGWLAARGEQGREPVQVGGRIPEYVGGSYAALAALTALRHRDGAEKAPVIDVSLLEAETCTLSYPMLMHESMEALGISRPSRAGALLGVVECKDGYIGINSLTGQQWLDICAMLGIPEFGERQVDVMFDPAVRDEFYAAAQPWLDEGTVEEILDLSQAMRIPSAPVGDGANLPKLAPFTERDYYRTYDSPEISFTEPSMPFRFGGDAGSPEPKARSNEPSRGERQLPFEDLVVLDLSTFWAGAYLACYLGSFGADVIKVESVQRPDGFRFTGAFPFEGDDWYERSGLFQGANLNKRGLTLNLNSPEGRDILMRLVESADVLIENYSPRVMENFGLTEDVLLERKPDLIFMRMPGFGLEGSWKNFVGWAYGIEQTAGMAQVTGYLDGPPLNPGGPADPIVGVHAGIALLAALEHRERTGEGQLVEVSQIEVAAALTAEQVIEYSLNGTVQGREGNRRRDIVQGVYPSKGEDTWVAISLRGDADWNALCSAMGNPHELSDPALTTTDGRLGEHDRVDRVIAAWTSEHSAETIVKTLRDAGVPVAEALVPAGMYGEPHLNARGFYTELEHPVSGPRRYPGWPFRFTPGPADHHHMPCPTLGEHNETILGTVLGLGADEISDLRQRDVIGHLPLGL